MSRRPLLAAALLAAVACAAAGAEAPGAAPEASSAPAADASTAAPAPGPALPAPAAVPALAAVSPAAAPAIGGLTALVPPPSTQFHIRPTAIVSEHLYEGDFLEPTSVCFDRKNRELWVADTKNNLVGAFTEEGVPLFAFGGDELREPAKVAVDGSGRVYVLDNDRSKVKVFSYRGQFLGPLDLAGAGPNANFGAIAFDDDGNLYVGENESCRVLVFGPDRKPRQRFGECGMEQGQFQAITGIAADKERIVVTDGQGVPVQVFDRRGDFVRGWGRHDMGAENFSLPQSVALDSKGHVIVIDTLRHEIKFFDLEGKFLDRFGGLGWRLGQVSFPAGIATDASDRLYVVEKGNSRVQVFAEVEGPIPPDGGGNGNGNGRVAPSPSERRPSAPPAD